MARLEEQVGAFVRHYRKRAGLTQAQLAEKVDRQPNAIQNIENGKAAPTFETLVRLAAALEVNARDLFGTDEFSAQEGRDDSLVEILKLISHLAEPELATIKSLIENALELRRS